MSGESPLHKPSRSFESRRKQATAIVMLAVLGAEFGLEILPTKRVVEEPKKGKKGLEGFTLNNYSLAQHTSKFLRVVVFCRHIEIMSMSSYLNIETQLH